MKSNLKDINWIKADIRRLDEKLDELSAIVHELKAKQEINSKMNFAILTLLLGIIGYILVI